MRDLILITISFLLGLGIGRFLTIKEKSCSHEWGKWKVTHRGVFTFQQKECTSCGVINEREV